MVSASKAVSEPIAAPPAAATKPIAQFNARISAYLVDSIILVALILVFVVLSGLELLIANNRTDGDPPEAAFYAAVAIFLGGLLLTWTALNLALLRWRGQTTGMYVIGIRAVSEDGRPLPMRRVVGRWLGLHPLLFHPFLLPVWALLSLVVVSEALSQAALIVTIMLVVLCIISPVAALITALADPERRALHDRLAGTVVVHLDNP